MKLPLNEQIAELMVERLHGDGYLKTYGCNDIAAEIIATFFPLNKKADPYELDEFDEISEQSIKKAFGYLSEQIGNELALAFRSGAAWQHGRNVTSQAKGDFDWQNAYRKANFMVEMTRIALATHTRSGETEEQRDRRALAKIEAIVYGRE